MLLDAPPLPIRLTPTGRAAAQHSAAQTRIKVAAGDGGFLPQRSGACLSVCVGLSVRTPRLAVRYFPETGVTLFCSSLEASIYVLLALVCTLQVYIGTECDVFSPAPTDRRPYVHVVPGLWKSRRAGSM